MFQRQRLHNKYYQQLGYIKHLNKNSVAEEKSRHPQNVRYLLDFMKLYKIITSSTHQLLCKQPFS